MDPVLNGDVSEVLLSKESDAKPEKSLDDEKETFKGEFLPSDTSKLNSTKKELKSLDPCPESSENGDLAEKGTTDISSESKTSIINVPEKDSVSNSNNTPLVQENGLHDMAELPHSEPNVNANNCNKNNNCPQKPSSKTDLPNKSITVGTEPVEVEPAMITETTPSLKSSEHDTDSFETTCSKIVNDKCQTDLNEPMDTSNSPDASTQDSEGKDEDAAKANSKSSEETVNLTKNNLLSGGSIIECNDQPDKNQELESFKNSMIRDIDKIIESVVNPSNEPSALNSSVVDKDSSSLSNATNSNEQPLNFAISNKVDQSPSNKTAVSPSESGLIDLSLNKQTGENPLKELNKHLKSIEGEKEQIPVHSDSQIDETNDTSLPLVDQKSNSNKENRSKECSHSHERSSKDSSDSFVFAELSKEETGFPDVFTGLVTIGKYISVKGDFTLRSSEALVESPSLVAPYLLKEPDSFPPKDKDSKPEVRDFFRSAAGEILVGIGLSRVNEWYHRDMVRIKKRQIKKNGKSPPLEEDLAVHEKFFSESKKANSVYSFTFKACKTCGFTTESSVVMEGHLLVPHVTQRREYQCNFCDIINRDPKAMLEHMESVHGKIGRIQPPVLFFECPYCAFESNSKVKLNNHLIKCQRYFDHGINQAPPKDFEFPALTPKPITVAVVKAYEKSLGSMHRGRGRPKKDMNDTQMNQFQANSNLTPTNPNHMPTFRASSNSPLTDCLSLQNQMISPMQMPNMNIRPAHANAMNQLRPIMGQLPLGSPNRFYQVVNQSGQLMPLLGNNHLVTSPSQFPYASNLDNSSGKKSNSGPYFNAMFGNAGQPPVPKSTSSVTITPLPKLQGPYPVPMAKSSTASGSSSMQTSSLVVCEICDGYIKDLEQLRTHMQLIHKVKIHPKMLVSRPPLNCQKCQWRFFTDQGLERHLLGAHGLVTSNMQELANKGKDAGCCTICGRVYASKLVSHMNQVHKITLKPAHLSYKCTVCSATFNLYRLFENHVYLVHSGAAKRSADGRSSPSKKLKSSGDTSVDGESVNHKDKKLPKAISDENTKKCKECGNDMSDKKSQREKCDKCLKSDGVVPGTLSTQTINDELRKKAIESAAV